MFSIRLDNASSPFFCASFNSAVSEIVNSLSPGLYSIAPAFAALRNPSSVSADVASISPPFSSIRCFKPIHFEGSA